MKILFYRYNSICEPDVMEQFERLGLELDVITAEMEKKSFTPEERVSLISDKLSKENYLFVFSINYFPVISEVCNIFKVPYVGWSVDSPLPEIYHKSIQNECNRMFMFDKKQFEEISPFNPGNVFHLPLGTNVDRWDRVTSSISADDRVKYASDISFVGSLYSEKDSFAKIKNPSDYLLGFTDGLLKVQSELQGINIIEKSLTPDIINELKEKLPSEFYGASFTVKDLDSYCAAHSILGMHCAVLERENILKSLSEHFRVDLYTRSDVSPFRDFKNVICHGGVATLTEMPKVFNLSKINLNITLRAIEKGASLRIWDVMGCGGFLMTNFQEEINDYLIAGEDYDFYADLGDLIEKCDFYLKNDDIRARIARTGYEKVKKYHTYANRMPEIFRALS